MVPAAGQRPTLPDEIPQYFIPARNISPETPIFYRPMLVGSATVHYSEIDKDESSIYLAAFGVGPVTLDWDSAPVDEMVVGWRVWGNGVLLGAASVPQCTVNIPNSATVLTVTAINSTGESPHSAPLTIPAPLVMIQRSTDLKTWVDVVQIPYEPTQFIRLETPAP